MIRDLSLTDFLLWLLKSRIRQLERSFRLLDDLVFAIAAGGHSHFS
jgi:hypothetical protein